MPIALCIWWLWLLIRCRWLNPATPMYRCATSETTLDTIDESAPSNTYRKPAWVRTTLIRLAATHPGWGCRPLTDLFNQRFSRHQLTVGKSFVAELVQKQQAEIREQRRQWRLRAPYVYPLHAVWGLDLTTLATQRCFGVIDHGSRQLMGLAVLPNKRTITILRMLLDIFERYGVPRSIRTDNEAMFTSLLFRLFLHCLGTRRQRIPPGCPWKNGRIERLFGTLKQTLAAWNLPSTLPLQTVLDHFHQYYNTYRPHQALNGHTPLQTAQQRPNTVAIKPNKRRR